MEDLKRVLEAHRALDDLDEAHVAFVVGCAKNVRFEAGQYLLREGEEANTFFLLRDGRVSLEVHAPGQGITQVETLQGGDLLGWSWLFPPYQWELDACALERVRAIAFDGACLRRKMEADHTLGYKLTRKVLQDLGSRLERVRMQRLDVYGAKEPA